MKGLFREGIVEKVIAQSCDAVVTHAGIHQLFTPILLWLI